MEACDMVQNLVCLATWGTASLQLLAFALFFPLHMSTQISSKPIIVYIIV